MDIGFIGLGQMGFHMARRLVEAGHRLTVCDVKPEAIDRLTALGARAAASPREVADAAETVMASLPTPDIVLAVATGAGGVIEGKRVRRFVDLSTTGAVMVPKICEGLPTVVTRLSVTLPAPIAWLKAMLLPPASEKPFQLMTARQLAWSMFIAAPLIPQPEMVPAATLPTAGKPAIEFGLIWAHAGGAAAPMQARDSASGRIRQCRRAAREERRELMSMPLHARARTLFVLSIQ